MIDPVTPATPVPWRGKTYDLQLTLGALAEASGCPGVPPILEGGPTSVWTKPPFFRLGVFLFAMVHRKFPDATLSECMDVVTGPNAELYAKIIDEAMEALVPAIGRLHGIEDKPSPPLAESSSGADSGPALVSTSALPRKSSGNTRRGN